MSDWKVNVSVDIFGKSLRCLLELIRLLGLLGLLRLGSIPNQL